MKADPIFLELESVKERLREQAGGDTGRFLDQMEAWLEEHPHPGPLASSVEALQARIREREASEPPPAPGEPYKIYDPVIAEVHRIRAGLAGERAEGLVLKDQPPPEGGE